MAITSYGRALASATLVLTRDSRVVGSYNRVITSDSMVITSYERAIATYSRVLTSKDVMRRFGIVEPLRTTTTHLPEVRGGSVALNYPEVVYSYPPHLVPPAKMQRNA